MAAETTLQEESGTPAIRAIGERIDTLLDAAAAGGAVAAERAEELVRLVTDLYGAGIERILDLLYDAGRLDAEMLDVLVSDDLVANLLLVHDLHPYDTAQRVEQALEKVRPYLGTHGGDVELVSVSDDVVQLRLLGSCDGCPSSSVTLELAVKEAIEAAAPEIARIEVQEAPKAETGSGTLISVQSLRTRLDQPDSTGSSWHPLSVELGPTGLTTATIDEISLVICRQGNDVLAFGNECPRCSSALDHARLERRLGGLAADPLLVCASCGAHFDLRRAGACVDVPELHLSPFPVIGEGAATTVALPVRSPA